MAEHAAARRHLGGDADRVVLCDERDGSLIELGMREWTLLRCADGTRDIAGVVRAAGEQGAAVRLAAAEEFFAALAAAGVVLDGDAPATMGGAGDGVDEPCEIPGDEHARVLEPFPGFGLHCDAGGECCGVYPSVYFTEPETARARAALPDVLDGGAQPARVFLPVQGAAPRGLYAVACVDGACAYLRADGRCGIHAVAGSAAKPAGCRLYPASFVDDGECVRVSAAPECPCVFRSAGRAGGEPLVPPGARTRADLEAAAFVARLPARVATAAGASEPRAQYVTWTREVLAAPAPGDPIAAGFALADAIESHGFRPGAATEALRAARAPAPAELYPWLEALYRRAARAAREHARFRSDRDRARAGTRRLAASAEALLDAKACARALAPDPVRAAAESFALRLSVHGHLLPGPRPLAETLREHAVRALVSREMPAAAMRDGAGDPALDPWCAEPLALVNALMRGHGLAAYANELVR